MAIKVNERNIRQISKNIIVVDDEFWHYYFKITQIRPKITGKYLFFCEQKEELEKIIVEELENHGFFHAKINTDETKRGKEYVLCLYYADDSRKQELAQRYKNNSKISYRYWKSDEATLTGKYSQEFLDKLSPDERKEWTTKKL